ncbi:DinB family protein [Flavobacterium fluviatile]|uniref:DinB family protein n=1 Tax=Flavobacterium fluviatile TaxID=1862387 RepID=UPI001FCB0655|nr:DinB family protein [Flavobacterium fluviatile]
MASMSKYAEEQYELVKSSRNVLFDFCRTISPDDFVNQNSSFGRGGSVRNLLVHIANTYEYWIGNTALKNDIVYAEYEQYNNITDVIKLFGQVDQFMDEFIKAIDCINEIHYKIQNVKSSAHPLKLFTHVITHEYHHKGQILSLSRHLNYIPVDTDILR